MCRMTVLNRLARSSSNSFAVVKNALMKNTTSGQNLNSVSVRPCMAAWNACS